MSKLISFPRIAILGGGPAGLTLSSLLSKAKIPYNTFELRPSPASKPSLETSPLVSSASLDLHVESGLLALRACGLWEQFCGLKSDCSEECVVSDMTGVRRYYDDGAGGQRPEIARNTLTSMLLGSLGSDGDENGKGMLRWGCKVSEVLPVEGEAKRGYMVRFATSDNVEHEEKFDIVLGADGAWSRLRSLITDVKPYYSTTNCITLTIPSITSNHPSLSTFIGNGSYHASGPHRAVMAQRGSFDSARLYLMLRDTEGKESYLKDQGLTGLSNAALKEKLLGSGGLFGDWGREVKELVEVGCNTSEQASVYPLYMLPIGHKWPHRSGLTLLGDAAHLMTPFAGEGVNCGMLDALELAELLIPAIKSVSAASDKGAESALKRMDEALKAYEEKMFERMEPVAQGTWDNLEMIFDETAPEPFVNFFLSHMPPPEDGAGGEEKVLA